MESTYEVCFGAAVIGEVQGKKEGDQDYADQFVYMEDH